MYPEPPLGAAEPVQLSGARQAQIWPICAAVTRALVPMRYGPPDCLSKTVARQRDGRHYRFVGFGPVEAQLSDPLWRGEPAPGPALAGRPCAAATGAG